MNDNQFIYTGGIICGMGLGMALQLFFFLIFLYYF